MNHSQLKEIIKKKASKTEFAIVTNLENGLSEIYEPEKFFTDERYEEVIIDSLEVDGYTLVDEGSFGSLDLVYLMQDKIGQKMQ